MSTYRKIIRKLASLKYAVVIMVVLAALIAAGTIVESKYDASVASKLVYKTPWMFITMGALAISLIAVMLDRWPWKRRHVSFICAHIGLLLLMAGALLTMFFGLDGTMRIGIGEKNNFVTTNDTVLSIWSSFDGDRFSKIFEKEVDFYSHPPAQKPLEISTMTGSLRVVDYLPFAYASKAISAADNSGFGAGVRFQIKNPNVNLNEWILQRKPTSTEGLSLGPARVSVGTIPEKPTGSNEIFIQPLDDKTMKYAIFYKDESRKTLRGQIYEGDAIETGWMGLEFRILRYIPHAEEKWSFEKTDHPTQMTTSAVEVEYEGKKQWLQLDDVIKIFSDNAVYILSYAHKRIDLGFDLYLKKFEIGRYQGTTKAESYQSSVEIPEYGTTLISMNEPMKHSGLTFYQASFQENEKGEPIASVLSVNCDPGRWLKYLGSLVLSVGIVWLFYNNKKKVK